MLIQQLHCFDDNPSQLARGAQQSPRLYYKATRWLSWYGVGLASADGLPVVVRIPVGPLGSLKCDPPKGNERRQKKYNKFSELHQQAQGLRAPSLSAMQLLDVGCA